MINKKKAIISLAIAIIFVLFIGYGIEVFDPTPDREDFCREDLYEIKEEEACTSSGGVWNDEKGPRPVIEGEFIERGFCGPGKECYDALQDATLKHDKIVFIVGIIVGILAIITGIIIKKDAISTGILSGGVLVILYGTLRYWRHADNTLKFVLLGITLAILLLIAYKKLDRKS